MKPNRLQQAIQEMQGLETNEIDLLINEGESKEYVYIGLKSKDSADGMKKIHGATKLFAPPPMHQEMVKKIKLFGGLWNGMYRKVIVLHDPTLPAHSDTTKKLSNILKGKVKEMNNDSIPAEEIAKVLEVDLVKVKQYISKLK